MPTGSLAPDSPSMITPARPRTSRLPSTENTTAGSVGASAVPSSSASGHATPNRTWASTATAAAVRRVPTTPRSRIGESADRSLRTPMPVPPSNRMRISATVTICSTASSGNPDNGGYRSEAAAAPIRKMAGAGIRSRWLIWLDSSASDTTAATTSRVRANASTPSSTCSACSCPRSGLRPAGQRTQD